MVRHRESYSPIRSAVGGIVITVMALASPFSAAIAADPAPEECTIAVLSGLATEDGRPIMWKNRDTSWDDNEVVYFDDGIYPYVALVNAGQTNKAWVGLNSEGFAIMNSLSHNFPDSLYGGITNGELMKKALQQCATVDDFEDLLWTTSKPGRENPANLGVIDGVGGAAMFEVGNFSWKRYDATNTGIAPQGFIARANFSFCADTSFVDTYRYHRARRILESAIELDRVDPRFMVQHVARDIRSEAVDPYPLPYEGVPPGYPDAKGYVETSNTINRRTTRAAGVVHGVQIGENPLLATFFALLGQPVVTIALPVWVAAGDTPSELDGDFTSPLCDMAISRMRASYDYPLYGSLLNTYRLIGNSRTTYLALSERVERWMFPIVEQHMEQWRETGVDAAKMKIVEAQIAAAAFRGYQGGPLPTETIPLAMCVMPNPMTTEATVCYKLDGDPPLGSTLDLIDVTGRRIRRFSMDDRTACVGSLTWDGCDANGTRAAAGVYFLKPSWGGAQASSSIVVTR